MKGATKAGSSAAAESPAAETEAPGAEEQLSTLTDPAEEAGEESVEETDADDATEETDEESQSDETDGETDEDDTTEEADDAETADKGKKREPASERRIHKLTAKSKAAESRATTAEARVKELEAGAMSNVPVGPDYLTAAERTLIEKANEVDSDLAWVAETMSAGQGGTHPRTKKEMTAQEVGREFGVLMGQQGTIARARAVYERAQALQWEDAKRGRAMRLATKKPAAAAAGAPAKKPPMRVAQPGAAAGKPVSESVKRQGVDIKRFEKAGATDEALAGELANL